MDMTQLAFQHVTTVPGGDDMFLSGITDMVVSQSSRGSVLYTVSRVAGGDVVAYLINGNGTLSLLDTQPLPGITQVGTVNTLALIADGSGTQELLVTGVNNTGLYRIALSADGTLSLPAPVTGANVPATLLDVTTAQLNGQTFIYSVARGSSDIGVLRETANGTVSFVQGHGLSDATSVGLTGVSQVQVGGNTILLAASGVDNALISYRLDETGTPLESDRIGAADGIGVGGANVVEVVEVGGQSFAILGASGSSTLSVAAVMEDGRLVLRDHILDSLDTRFAGVQDVASVVHNGRAFVAAGGSDDGVSLFELMPGGRLRHISSLEDAVVTTLDAVSAISLTVVNDMLHLTASSATEAGLTAFSVDIAHLASPLDGGAGQDSLTGGIGADLILGGGGNDTLRGQAGDDVLVDGAGSDTLWGGAGADIFVLSGDGARDTIQDFDHSEDQLDLSNWSFLRSAGQLTFHALNDGIFLRFGTEELLIRTANGQSLDANEILALNVVGVSRWLPDWALVESDLVPDPTPDPEPNPDPGPTPDPAPMVALILTGSNDHDTLVGGFGNDSLQGLDGSDDLSGMGGADTLSGDRGNDALSGNAGNDSLRGGDGDDSLNGGTGIDTLLGDDGADTISAAGGNDEIDGGAGNDALSGNAGNDSIQGGSGHDEILGGVGFDAIYGGGGNDSIQGNDGFDLIEGGAGDDLISGNNGTDNLYGDDGQDTLSGGLGNDFLSGGDGQDALSGGAGPDELHGNAGNDVLNGNAGFDLLLGGDDDDTLNGGLQHDTLYGGAGRDLLNGNTGQDSLYGEAGDDTLLGNSGNDTLDGGPGDDLLLGGRGADSFVFSHGADTIGDFQNNVDTLVLDSDLWGGGTLSVQELFAYSTGTEDGLVFDFGNGHTLTLANVHSINVLNNDLEFL